MYAGFWKRLAAAMLDLMILLVPTFLAGIVVALVTGPKSRATFAADLGALAVVWLYFAVMESSRWQATLGKSAFGIRVVDLDGERISFLRANGRLAAKIFSAVSLLVGFLMAGIMPRKQALHDIIAGTLVVNSEARRAELERTLPVRVPTVAAILAITLAVVCIPLAGAGAAIAIPAYQDYTVKLEVSDAVSSVRTATAGVAAYMARYKRPPVSLEDARAVPRSPYLREAVITGEGTIVLTLAVQKLEGKKIVFVPTGGAPERMTWTCSSEEVAPRYLPRQCRR